MKKIDSIVAAAQIALAYFPFQPLVTAYDSVSPAKGFLHNVVETPLSTSIATSILMYDINYAYMMIQKHMPNFDHISSPRQAALMLTHVIIGPRNFQAIPLLNALSIRNQWDDVGTAILVSQYANEFPEIFTIISEMLEKDKFIYTNQEHKRP